VVVPSTKRPRDNSPGPLSRTRQRLAPGAHAFRFSPVHDPHLNTHLADTTNAFPSDTPLLPSFVSGWHGASTSRPVSFSLSPGPTRPAHNPPPVSIAPAGWVDPVLSPCARSSPGVISLREFSALTALAFRLTFF
ncbi:hypothetical protein FA95DRAFT_1557834, partial [Auriscalpium vulgare]